MQLLEVLGKSVNILERELRLVEPPHDVQNVQRPAARLSTALRTGILNPWMAEEAGFWKPWRAGSQSAR